jgi:hypothetical protein
MEEDCAIRVEMNYKIVGCNFFGVMRGSARVVLCGLKAEHNGSLAEE